MIIKIIHTWQVAFKPGFFLLLLVVLSLLFAYCHGNDKCIFWLASKIIFKNVLFVHL